MTKEEIVVMNTLTHENEPGYLEVLVYPSLAIANELIKRSQFSVSPMKLQKLVYYAHGWCLKLTGNALIDDSFEAWQYGPVVESIYHAFKGFGNRNIERLANDYTQNTFGVDPDDNQASILVDKILEVYGPLDAILLSNKTHQTDSPWDIVYNQEGRPGGVISNELIMSRFQP